jgi:hypothetical protein
MVRNVWRPDLSDAEVRDRLVPRKSPYFELISYCRHLGLEVSLRCGRSRTAGRIAASDPERMRQ